MTDTVIVITQPTPGECRVCCPFSLKIRLANCFFLLILTIFPFKNCHHHCVCMCVCARAQVCEDQRTTSQDWFLPPALLCQSLFSLRGTLQVNFRASIFPGFCHTTCVLGFQAPQGSIRLFLCITGLNLGCQACLASSFTH